MSSQDLCSWELPKLMMELVTRSFSEQRSGNPCKQEAGFRWKVDADNFY